MPQTVFDKATERFFRLRCPLTGQFIPATEDVDDEWLENELG